MATNQQYHAVTQQPDVIISYRNDDELIHWDGAFFGVLCLVSWLFFVCSWARIHVNKLERRPPPLPPLKPENFIGSNHWRN
jgi:hypothetical protein